MATELVNETDDATAEAKSAFLRRVCIRGYKSIAFCDVTLEPLTILVGRNATGKSNFVDALAFLRDALATNLVEATKRRGGWKSICTRFLASADISFDLEIALPPMNPASGGNGDSPQSASYGLTIREGPADLPVVTREQLRASGVVNGRIANLERTGTFDPGQLQVEYRWRLDGTEIQFSQVSQPRPDHLWLGSLVNQPFARIAESLRSLGHYNFNPEAIRTPQRHLPGNYLERDGRNLASVIETTREVDSWAADRAACYLSAIAPSVEVAGVSTSGSFDWLRFRVGRDGQGPPLEFDAANMSDGTLRALAMLIAAFQIVLPHGSPSLVAIEEPETSLHPAATRALIAALDEATLRTQILLTTHSTALLDAPEVKPKNIRVVQMVGGRTVIAPLDAAGKEIAHRSLNSLGGLERDDLLEPDLDDLERQRQLERNGQGAAH